MQAFADCDASVGLVLGSFVAYIIAGFTKSVWISLPAGLMLLVAGLFILKSKNVKKA